MLRKLLALGARGWWRLAEAQLCILRAHFKLWWSPLGALVSIAPAHPIVPGIEGPGDSAAPSPDVLGLALNLAQAVERVSRLGLTRPLCLARSIALADLLARHRLTGSEVHVGVRMRDGMLMAHAWVRWRGQILGDTADNIRTFTRLRDLSVLPSTRAFASNRTVLS